MQKFYRFGDERLRYYTEWKRNSENGCIYCGAPATTREHIPPKAFLKEPFPDNLPTIPACFKCNNGFSCDENYVACYLEILKSKIYKESSVNSKIAERLEKNPEMTERIESQIKIKNEKINLRYDKKRFENILVKLAKGHVGYEFEYVDFNHIKDVWYDFSFRMNDKQIEEFDDIIVMDIMPEIGSTAFNRLCILDNPNSRGKLYNFLEEVNVQEGEYRYNVYFDNDDICVKIVIVEILFCIVKFEKH